MPKKVSSVCQNMSRVTWTLVNFNNILEATFEPTFFPKKLQSQTEIRVKLAAKHFCAKKGRRKMLLKLTLNCYLLYQ